MDLCEHDKQIKKLIFILTALPPDFTLAKRLLNEWALPSEVLSRVACDIVENQCFCEYQDALGNDYLPQTVEKLDGKGVIIDKKLVSYYLPEILALLLDFGLNPNDVLGEKHNQSNLIEALKYVDYKDCAAHCVKLLMEHGGDPNLIVDGESIFESVDFDVVIDISERYNRPHVIPYWLVLIGFGGHLNADKKPLTMSKGYGSEIFKNYNLFEWRIEWVNPTLEHRDRWIMHIYEASSGIEVAML